MTTIDDGCRIGFSGVETGRIRTTCFAALLLVLAGGTGACAART
jgi:hypothetical protein